MVVMSDWLFENMLPSVPVAAVAMAMSYHERHDISTKSLQTNKLSFCIYFGLCGVDYRDSVINCVIVISGELFTHPHISLSLSYSLYSYNIMLLGDRPSLPVVTLVSFLERVCIHSCPCHRSHFQKQQYSSLVYQPLP